METLETRLDEVARIAVRLEQQTACPAQLLIAPCRDYAWLITNGEPYHGAWQQYQQHRDLRALIVAVAGTYATDPGYAHLVVAIAGQMNVKRAITQAVQEATPHATMP